MSSSLEKLISNITACGKCRNCNFKNKPCKTPTDVDLKITKSLFNDNEGELLLKKGVYPYDYMGSLKKLDETKLPQKKNPFTQNYRALILVITV